MNVTQFGLGLGLDLGLDLGLGLESNNSQTIGLIVIGAFMPFIFWLMSILCSCPTTHCVPPFDIKDDYYDTSLRMMGNAKVKHRILLVRHGESEHNKRHDGKDGVKLPEIPDLDTPLTCSGREQAVQVGGFLSKFDWHPDIIRISPMLRARQTAEPFFQKFFGMSQLHACDGFETVLETTKGKKTRCIDDAQCLEVNVWCDQKLKDADLVTKKETYQEFIERVRRWKKQLEEDSFRDNSDERMQTLVFTHSMVISELLNLIVSETRENISEETWSKIYWQVSHGSITCIDYMDNKEWHVHTMNYTTHLTLHTCPKSPFI